MLEGTHQVKMDQLKDRKIQLLTEALEGFIQQVPIPAELGRPSPDYFRDQLAQAKTALAFNHLSELQA